MKKKILFLDDDPLRHIIFWQHHKDHDLVQVTLPERAISDLQMQKFDEVWLDHDLGEVINISKFVIDSKPVVRWIADNKKPEDIPLIVIHSWNISAATWMELYLKDYGFNVIVSPFILKKL